MVLKKTWIYDKILYLCRLGGISFTVAEIMDWFATGIVDLSEPKGRQQKIFCPECSTHYEKF
jgi:hypothetical protein